MSRNVVQFSLSGKPPPMAQAISFSIHSRKRSCDLMPLILSNKDEDNGFLITYGGISCGIEFSFSVCLAEKFGTSNVNFRISGKPRKKHDIPKRFTAITFHE